MIELICSYDKFILKIEQLLNSQQHTHDQLDRYRLFNDLTILKQNNNFVVSNEDKNKLFKTLQYWSDPISGIHKLFDEDILFSQYLSDKSINGVVEKVLMLVFNTKNIPNYTDLICLVIEIRNRSTCDYSQSIIAQLVQLSQLKFNSTQIKYLLTNLNNDWNRTIKTTYYYSLMNKIYQTKRDSE